MATTKNLTRISACVPGICCLCAVVWTDILTQAKPRRVDGEGTLPRHYFEFVSDSVAVASASDVVLELVQLDRERSEAEAALKKAKQSLESAHREKMAADKELQERLARIDTELQPQKTQLSKCASQVNELRQRFDKLSDEVSACFIPQSSSVVNVCVQAMTSAALPADVCFPNGTVNVKVCEGLRTYRYCKAASRKNARNGSIVACWDSARTRSRLHGPYGTSLLFRRIIITS